ncbi:NitT/TauT family transport system ATP-binding protein [Clostridium acetobutylicum]|uniref:ABC-type quaternary amine transporter n=1 Tax=Clostridium acetobutylicum (strain ATCC 824 / DSM 792 / JCM 1419 / IAM 19013 / LMG 5710 / NBRC 13948 / NRRL B-527 / VKM B-1787 / 2291 / W) TaxID=272562 RepID=Q97MT4_CLOAB|nr:MULTISPECIES: ATP-binding cassette domain-containing protein [Clostridium]AAK78092.1 ABC-type sulfate transporter, ATPase component [Clostridium acetobutylicum ATCC 824]ADZ19151.1 ABC-type sulfate transporter, ATPase component [Clostridium acetobutylicum EA 2018]AEI31063.1 ABC-type sulfate transporter, ATPase component [Clostridium acetobutylicum DSM 1731]AWV81845.1 ABC transporter ATP-binding protein [Clostridium acetobutylicum]MBC2395393.1 ABC transporter ATP-binding protein [Clostridium 
MGIEIKGVSKDFISKEKKVHTLDEVNLSIKKGEFICLLGPSGCGKSTLLNIIAGLEKPTKGIVYLNNMEIKAPGPDRAFMFQESALFPWLKVIDNVEFGMKIKDVPKEERREKALKYLKMVHLTKFQNSYVHELSGGMRQRVALARALTLDSEVLLMDEPFSALDSQTKSILQLELQNIWWETKKTIVFVTHNVEEAVLLADRVVVMAANPGRIKNIFEIKLARPREAQSVDLSYVAREVMRDLKEEVEKVAKTEYDSDWNFQKSSVLYNSDSDLGANL